MQRSAGSPSKQYEPSCDGSDSEDEGVGRFVEFDRRKYNYSYSQSIASKGTKAAFHGMYTDDGGSIEDFSQNRV